MPSPKKTRQSAAAAPQLSSEAPAMEMTKEDSSQEEPMFREDRIRLAAYRLSLSREPGNADPVADWLEAESSIDAEDAR